MNCLVSIKSIPHLLFLNQKLSLTKTQTHLRLSTSTMAQLPPFITGWRKLPDELKLQIVDYILPTDIYLSHFNNIGLSVAPSPFECFVDRYTSGVARSTEVQPLLACPETSGLVLEALYKTATTYIVVNDRTDGVGLPPQAVRSHIRKMEVVIKIRPECVPSLAHLARVLKPTRALVSHHWQPRRESGLPSHTQGRRDRSHAVSPLRHTTAIDYLSSRSQVQARQYASTR
jgi:hypothetical protein